jgi:hypothetical protein
MSQDTVPICIALTKPLIPWITLLDFRGGLIKSASELVTEELAQLSTYSGTDSVSKRNLQLSARFVELNAVAVRQHEG